VVGHPISLNQNRMLKDSKMAEYFLPHLQEIRPARDKQAPWSSLGNKARPLKGRLRAVVYVLEQVDGPVCKMGRTTQLKKRLSEIERDVGSPMAIAFWAEYVAVDAKAVERLALKMAGDCVKPYRGAEWFHSGSKLLAESVLLSARHLGIRHIAQAGIPEGVDHYVSDEAVMIHEDSERFMTDAKAGPTPWGE